MNRKQNQSPSPKKSRNQSLSLSQNKSQSLSRNLSRNQSQSLSRNLSQSLSRNQSQNQSLSLSRNLSQSLSQNKSQNQSQSLSRNLSQLKCLSLMPRRIQLYLKRQPIGLSQSLKLGPASHRTRSKMVLPSGGGTLLGTINSVEENPDSTPDKVFIDMMLNEYFGIELGYDSIIAETRTTSGKSDGDVEMSGPVVSLLLRLPNESNFTPFAGVGLAFFGGDFDEEAHWAPGLSRPGVIPSRGITKHPSQWAKKKNGCGRRYRLCFHGRPHVKTDGKRRRRFLYPLHGCGKRRPHLSGPRMAEPKT